jgi:hypothetical protein
MAYPSLAAAGEETPVPADPTLREWESPRGGGDGDVAAAEDGDSATAGDGGCTAGSLSFIVLIVSRKSTIAS